MSAFFSPAAKLTACILAMFALAGCDLVDKTPPYRYRMTVEVETPAGLKTGSTVIGVETDVAGKYAIPTPRRVDSRMRGQAAAVDLGDGQVLFALLQSEESFDWAATIMFQLAPNYSGENAFEASYEAMLKRRSAIRVPRRWGSGLLRGDSAYPMLMTFEDLQDPESAVKVDPDDLAARFGEGVRLKQITVQMTNDPVSTGIERWLPWLDDFRDKTFDGSSAAARDLTKDELKYTLSAASFSTEFYR